MAASAAAHGGESSLIDRKATAVFQKRCEFVEVVNIQVVIAPPRAHLAGAVASVARLVAWANFRHWQPRAGASAYAAVFIGHFGKLTIALADVCRCLAVGDGLANIRGQPRCVFVVKSVAVVAVPIIATVGNLELLAEFG